MPYCWQGFFPPNLCVPDMYWRADTASLSNPLIDAETLFGLVNAFDEVSQTQIGPLSAAGRTAEITFVSAISSGGTSVEVPWSTFPGWFQNGLTPLTNGSAGEADGPKAAFDDEYGIDIVAEGLPAVPGTRIFTATALHLYAGLSNGVGSIGQPCLDEPNGPSCPEVVNVDPTLDPNTLAPDRLGAPVGAPTFVSQVSVTAVGGRAWVLWFRNTAPTQPMLTSYDYATAIMTQNGVST